jgi:Na+-transporting NADH:ubiquinone oxidoreductase subunit NqrF
MNRISTIVALLLSVSSVCAFNVPFLERKANEFLKDPEMKLFIEDQIKTHLDIDSTKKILKSSLKMSSPVESSDENELSCSSCRIAMRTVD